MGTAFFGIGAMRAGTTWLYHVLSQHPDCAISPVKELHFFDTKYGLGGGDRFYLNRAYYLAALSRSAANNLTRIMKRFAPEAHAPGGAMADELDGAASAELEWTDAIRRRLFKRANIQGQLKFVSQVIDCLTIVDTDSYVEYLTRHGGGAAAFGEITPAYALLPAEGFREMGRLFPNSVFIFMMRDPVDRLWSHARYGTGKADKKGRPPPDPNVAFAAALRRVRLSRSMYQQTVTTLESVIPKERILYLFYEDVVSDEKGPGEIARVEKVLGLKPLNLSAETFKETKNAAPTAPLSKQNEADAMEALGPVYRFVEEKFGHIEGWRRPA